MRVECLQRFHAKRDGATDRQLLNVGEIVTLDDDAPHTKTLLADGFARKVSDSKEPKAPKEPKA